MCVGSSSVDEKKLYRFSNSLQRSLVPSVDVKSFGPWGLVTGATDGIGRAYADVLASKGLNVVVVSRSEEKLQVCTSEAFSCLLPHF